MDLEVVNPAKQFRIDARIKNNLLIRARESLGYLTAKSAAEALKVSYETLVGYEGLRKSPWDRYGEWNRSAIAIASAYRTLPETLWTEAIVGVKRHRVQMEVDVPVAGMFEPPSDPERLMLEADNRESLAAALESLTERERTLVTARFGLEDGNEATLDRAGELIGGISRERVRQLELRTMRKLREFAKKHSNNESWICCICRSSFLFRKVAPHTVDGISLCGHPCMRAWQKCWSTRDPLILYTGPSKWFVSWCFRGKIVNLVARDEYRSLTSRNRPYKVNVSLASDQEVTTTAVTEKQARDLAIELSSCELVRVWRTRCEA